MQYKVKFNSHHLFVTLVSCLRVFNINNNSLSSSHKFNMNYDRDKPKQHLNISTPAFNKASSIYFCETCKIRSYPHKMQQLLPVYSVYLDILMLLLLYVCETHLF